MTKNINLGFCLFCRFCRFCLLFTLGSLFLSLPELNASSEIKIPSLKPEIAFRLPDGFVWKNLGEGGEATKGEEVVYLELNIGKSVSDEIEKITKYLEEKGVKLNTKSLNQKVIGIKESGAGKNTGTVCLWDGEKGMEEKIRVAAFFSKAKEEKILLLILFYRAESSADPQNKIAENDFNKIIQSIGKE